MYISPSRYDQLLLEQNLRITTLSHKLTMILPTVSVKAPHPVFFRCPVLHVLQKEPSYVLLPVTCNWFVRI